VVQNLRRSFSLDKCLSYSSEFGYARNKLWIHSESHRLGVRSESRPLGPLGLRILGFARFYGVELVLGSGAFGTSMLQQLISRSKATRSLTSSCQVTKEAPRIRAFKEAWSTSLK